MKLAFRRLTAMDVPEDCALPAINPYRAAGTTS